MWSVGHEQKFVCWMMKKKKLALISFVIPFALGGGFISLGTVLDRLAKPDTDEYKILLDGFLDLLYAGTIFGVISTILVLAVAGIFSRMAATTKSSSN